MLGTQRLVDSDGHYYEAPDCFTRHLPRAYRDRSVTVSADGAVCMAGQPFVFHPVAMTHYGLGPGCMRGVIEGTSDVENPVPDPGLDLGFAVHRDQRLSLMDEQEVRATLLFPTLGLTVWPQFAQLGADVTYANLRSFNAWLDEDWGFAHGERIFAPPLLSVLDPERALAEVEHLLKAGAPVINLLPSCPLLGTHFGDPALDPIWARLNEAGTLLTVHAGNSGYQHVYDPTETCDQTAIPAFGFALVTERAIMDSLGALILGDVFGRFPKLKVASIENGSRWVPYLIDCIDRSARISRVPWTRSADRRQPSDVFRRHVLVSPFTSEDLGALSRLIGVDALLFGSDFPHPEGLPDPRLYTEALADFSEVDAGKVLGGTLSGLLQLAA